MSFKQIKFWMFATIALLCLPAGARAQSCAYAAVNASCTLTLDRLNPVAPPTIYVRRGSQVTVLVDHPLPFEHLTLDQKSAAEQLPADQFRNGFADITTALGGLVITNIPAAAAPLELGVGGGENAIPGRPAPQQKQPPPCPSSGPTNADEFKSCQSDIATPLQAALKVRSIADPPDPVMNFGTWVYSRLCSIHKLFMPLQSAAVSPDNPTMVCRDLPPDITALNIPMDGSQMNVWKSSFAEGSNVVTTMKDLLEGIPKNHLPGWNDEIAGLDADLAGARRNHTISPSDYVTLNAAQQVLHSAADTAAGYQAKMQALITEVAALVQFDGPNPMTISDQHAGSKDNEVQTWDLNAGNRLAGVAGQVKADKYGGQITRLMGSLADAPTKQTVVEFKIQFLNEPRLEISSGLLVPLRPYHSFSEATPYSSATATSGSCTAGTTTPSAPTNCPIVQQTSTIAIVPEVSFNILLGHELALGKQRAAWMWTIAAGYNSATASAAFGTGLSFSYRSMVFSLVPIVDQEQHLTGGYQVNQSAGTATTPTTTNSWKVNPSLGISLRVPLGGSTQ